MPTMPGTFRAPNAPSRVERSQAYERSRGSARQRGYSTKWDKASKAYLSRRPICPACQAADVLTASEVTDHIIPHKGDKALFWSRENWQPCCRWHHDVVKQALEREFEHGRVKVSDLHLTSARALSVAARLRP